MKWLQIRLDDKTHKQFSELLGIKYRTFLYHKQNTYPEINTYFYKRKIKGYWYFFITAENAKIVKEYIEKKKEKEKNDEEKLIHWTQTALECYERNCICSITCSNWEFCNRREKELGYKPMKRKVIELVREYGKPIRRD